MPPVLRGIAAGFGLVALALIGTHVAASEQPPRAAVATAHPLATQAARTVLGDGGNAFDAAVTASAVLAVVEPYGSGIGGGGFYLLHEAEENRTVMVDGRERAPLEAHRDMYVDEKGQKRPRASLDGPLAAAIPGEPAALVHLAEHYGQLPLSRTLAPAIRLAREGFAVGPDYGRMARFRLEALRQHPRSVGIFLDDGAVPEPEWVLKQPDLADTLARLAEHGRAGFYEGPVAQTMVEAVQEAGGLWTHEDLADYAVVEREPVVFDHRGIRVSAAAPPSAGGIGLATMLNILAGYDLASMDRAQRVHYVVEAMRRAYRDRNRYLGDPDFIEIPRDRLTSRDYAQKLRTGIDDDEATPSAKLSASAGGRHTTHFSILDTQGNRVAATLSINYPFGSGFVAGESGVLLNDEMDDFAARPGKPNAYGLIGGDANAIEPGKRPLSSMTPTFLDDGQRLAILGTPGGSRIVTMVLLATLAYERETPPATWVGLPRYHHQYLPDVIQHEPDTFDAAIKEKLSAMGHELKSIDRRYGDMQAILWDRSTETVEAASDPRGQGDSAVFEIEPAASAAQ